MKTSILFILIFSFVVPPVAVYTAMTGGNFEIYSDTISVLDGQSALGGDFSLSDTAGEFFATTTSGGSLLLQSGFQAITRDGISLSIDNSSLNLGELSQTSVASASAILTVGTGSITGYSVSISEDGNLRDGLGNDISDVTDGTVSAGAEEYGIRTSGGAGVLGSDTAITSSLLVASRSESIANDQTTVLFRASIDNNTTAGSYAHTVTFTLTANP